MAFRILKRKETAADAVQVTFMRLWRSRERYRPPETFLRWFVRISLNVSIDSYRQSKKLKMEVPIGDSLHQRHSDRDAEFARIHWLTIRRVFRAFPIAPRTLASLRSSEAREFS